MPDLNFKQILEVLTFQATLLTLLLNPLEIHPMSSSPPLETLKVYYIDTVLWAADSDHMSVLTNDSPQHQVHSDMEVHSREYVALFV